MAENEDGMEKSEEPTDERREEFRKKGDIPNSRELTSVGVLFTAIMVLTSLAGWIYERLHKILTKVFAMTKDFRINQENTIDFMGKIWLETILIVIPVGLAIILISMLFTFGQTKLNFSWEKLKPNFKKFNPISNLQRILGSQSIVELSKSFLKMLFISLVAFFILWGEFDKVPALLQLDVISSWSYWGAITKKLFLGVSGLMLIVAAIDYGYNWFQIEKKMKMTKKEVKDEFKNREIDPFIKGQLRQRGRELISGQMIENTRKATVVVANPTHFSVALLYERGMFAPVVVAKGVDDLALKMREVAKDSEVPVVENKPLARAMYKTLEVGDEIPESLFKAVSEVIRHVYKLKGIDITKTGTQELKPEMA